MGKKQKKKQKGRAAAAAELTREEAREEVRGLIWPAQALQPGGRSVSKPSDAAF